MQPSPWWDFKESKRTNLVQVVVVGRDCMFFQRYGNAMSTGSVAHPWHGVSHGDSIPDVVVSFIEIVPTDVMKYEVDKVSGHMRLDRPQRFSSQCPCLYGFVPRTFCGTTVAQYCEKKLMRSGLRGDGDPLDILVLSERPIQHSGVLLESAPIGGLRLIDRGEVDDKLIAVLVGDAHYEGVRDISELPKGILDRVQHYFLTYKSLPGITPNVVEIAGVYGRDEAHDVIRASIYDYEHEISQLVAK